MFFILFLISVVFTLLYGGLYIYATVAGKMVPLVNPMRPLAFFEGKKLFTYNFAASIIGICIFIVYVPIAMFVLYSGFEKTQSIEIIYFSGFVIACFTESIRIVMPMFGLWKTFSVLFFFTGQVVSTGRVLSMLSFLFAAIFSGEEHRQEVERNYVIMLVVSILIGMIIPLDTSRIVSTCVIHCGYSGLFNRVQLILFLTTLLATLINAFSKDSAELKVNAIGYVILIMGYMLLRNTDNYVTLFVSTALFAVGNVLYLRSIHTLCLWR